MDILSMADSLPMLDHTSDTLLDYDEMLSPSLAPLTKLSADTLLDTLEEEKEPYNTPMSPEEYATLLEPDSDILTLPVIEVVFGESIHELFFASSDAYKTERQNVAHHSFAYGPVLFDSEDKLLEESLTVLFSRFRSELVKAHYGVDAEHYEIHLTFKGLNDLWLPEHDSGAASSISLSSLVKLYTDVAEESGQGLVQLEPFRIELTLQETFSSRLDALQIQLDEARAQKDLSVAQGAAAAAVAQAELTLQELDGVHKDTVICAPEEQAQSTRPAMETDQLVSFEEDAEASEELLALDSVHRQNEKNEKNEGMAREADGLGTTLESVAAPERADIDSDDYLLDSAEIEPLEDNLVEDSDLTVNFEVDFVALKSTSSGDRSPKRSLDEFLELSDAEFDEMCPDREDPKKARVQD